MKNIELDIVDINSKNSNNEKSLLKKDYLKGQKILIVMLYSKELNPEESEYIHKDYLLKNIPKNDSCLKDCLDYYGINIDIVENYRDAIEKITSKNEKGKCPYYAVWIINGPPYEELPDGTKEAFLFGQFLEVINVNLLHGWSFHSFFSIQKLLYKKICYILLFVFFTNIK